MSKIILILQGGYFFSYICIVEDLVSVFVFNFCRGSQKIWWDGNYLSNQGWLNAEHNSLGQSVQSVTSLQQDVSSCLNVWFHHSFSAQVSAESANQFGELVADPVTNELLHYTEKPETFVSTSSAIHLLFRSLPIIWFNIF